jgi:hypothetical protein
VRLAVWLAVLASVALLAFALRTRILRAAGWSLVADDPIGPADVIVLTIDAGAAGVLEAADLVREGIANRVAVFVEKPDPVDNEYIRRGYKYEDRADRWLRMLTNMGVTNLERIPVPVNGTEAEGQFLPQWCAERHLGVVVVVTTPDHSRRVRRVLRREMKGHATKVMVRATRFSVFQPDAWWQTRAGTRVGLVELEKLFLDVSRHPFN